MGFVEMRPIEGGDRDVGLIYAGELGEDISGGARLT